MSPPRNKAPASALDASKRTLSRSAQRETGMSFVRWKQQVHVGLALQKLALGETVTNISLDRGHESPDSFIAMFCRMLGISMKRPMPVAF